ncbi:hypothetical protein NT2_01_04570 [Caenibius tardaugens NBRC 16725]|uniref:Spore coat protein U/FanG domain-containing protein n=1 Tax=Caenibius tardaugens NBRC 16725 TaxID=1219035 RepID=U2YHP1_9SPHN|nr:SCPU domain-containing protein [Caenibius tardaugens NBRC 16725]GAD47685.1 hypothetical protein NT2_01_04570 [Caenibius tardaugens NBRC 16725]
MLLAYFRFSHKLGRFTLQIQRIGLALAGLFVVASPAHATIDGSLDATITLTAACIINEANTADGATGIDYGTIDFGSQNTYFSTADAELEGSVGTGIEIQCSNGTTPVLAFGGGENAGSGTSNTGTTGARAMEHGTEAGTFVTYNLYSDSSGGTIIPVDGTIALDADGSAQTIPVFGRAFGADNLFTGQYHDLVVVTLTL